MMKLFYSPASPYARKVRAVALEAGLADSIELIGSVPLNADDALHSVNPLGRVPALVLEDGSWLVDSPVICEYLDHRGGSGLFPPPGELRWTALKLQAVGDGLMDSSVPWRQELMRPEPERSAEWLARRERQVRATLAYLEESPGVLGHWNIGTLSVACAWDYLQFRFGDRDWSGEFPTLAVWFERAGSRPSLAETKPS